MFLKSDFQGPEYSDVAAMWIGQHGAALLCAEYIAETIDGVEYTKDKVIADAQMCIDENVLNMFAPDGSDEAIFTFEGLLARIIPWYVRTLEIKASSLPLGIGDTVCICEWDAPKRDNPMAIKYTVGYKRPLLFNPHNQADRMQGRRFFRYIVPVYAKPAAPVQ